jgi:hypothetical protein
MELVLKLPNPEHMNKKVDSIKAVRALTGLGLKQAKAVVDQLGEGKSQMIDVILHPTDRRDHYDTFQLNGITVMEKFAGNSYVKDIRNLSIRALKNGDYTVAVDVIELLQKVDSFGR